MERGFGVDCDERNNNDEPIRPARAGINQPSSKQQQQQFEDFNGRNGGLGIRMAWKAEAAAARERRVEELRRVGLFVLVALVLFPPYLVGLLGFGIGAVYMCIVAVRSCIRNRGV